MIKKVHQINYIIILLMIVMTLCVTTNSLRAETLFSDDFENGISDKWDYHWHPDDINIDSFAHTGNYSVRMDYEIAAGGSEHRSRDVCLIKKWSVEDNIEKISVRGYVYIPYHNTPHEGSSRTWRKLFYLKGHDYSWTQTVSVTDSWNPAMLKVTAGGNENVWNLADFTYDKWHCLELNLKLNTVGESNGEIKIYLDGEKIYENNSAVTREPGEDEPLKSVLVGEQVDKNGDTLKRDVYRYWDDIVMSTKHIGPIENEDNTNGTESKLKLPIKFKVSQQ